MNIIDLVDGKSNVTVKTTVFPDGEPHISIEGIRRKEDAIVTCRITNPNDLFILMQVNDIMTRQGVDWQLCIMYLMSMRMDRVIHFEEAFSLKVVTDIINGFSCSKVFVYHPHSSRSVRLLNKCEGNAETNDKIDNMYMKYVCSFIGNNVALCYPDAGAKERYEEKYKMVATRYIALSKVRDLENMGQIKSIEISEIHDEPWVNKADTILVTDDLCDAGGTFAWSAKVLREKYPDKKLAIMVRHMVNPKGIENLCSIYDEVFITSSYKNWESDHKNLHVYTF